MNVTKIYLSEEEDNGKLNYDVLHTDVIVQSDTGHTYCAKFIAIQKLIDDIKAHRESEKNPSSKYYWSKHMVIVNDIDKQDLVPIVNHMIQEGDFQMIFRKLS